MIDCNDVEWLDEGYETEVNKRALTQTVGLSTKQIGSNRNKYAAIAAQLFGDEAATSLMTLLDRTDFFVAPYTTKYKGSYVGGLCEHCLNVYDRAKDKSIELAQIALIHDIGKVNYFKYDQFTKKVNGQWQGGYKVKEPSDRRPLGNFGFKSYIMTRNILDFTEDQIVALCNFVYVSRQNDCVEILTMMEQNKLITGLHLIDIEEVYC